MKILKKYQLQLSAILRLYGDGDAVATQDVADEYSLIPVREYAKEIKPPDDITLVVVKVVE